MLILAGTFAYSFNAIGMILQEMNMNSNFLKYEYKFYKNFY